MDGQAGGQDAVVASPSPEPGEAGDDGRLVEINEKALADEQRGPAGIVAGRFEDVAHLIHSEVDGGEGEIGDVGCDRHHAPPIIDLRGRVVELEEANTGGVETESSVVVARTQHGDLGDTSGNGRQYLVIDEAGPGSHMGTKCGGG